MAVKKNNNGLLLKLLGVGIAYQVLHQVYMWQTLHNEFDSGSLDDECAASPAGKPLCLEAQLFRSWERASEVDADHVHGLLEFRAAADTTQTPADLPKEDEVAVLAAKAVAAKASHEARRQLDELFDGVLLALNTSSSVESMAGDLKQLQQTLQSRMETLPETHKKLAEDTVAELDSQLNAVPSDGKFEELYADVSKALSNRTAETPWAKELVEVQHKLEAASQHSKPRDTTAEPVNPWVQSLVDLQKNLETRKQELDRVHKAHHAAIMEHHNHPHSITNWDDFDKAYEEIMHSIKSTTLSPFAQGLIDSQAKLQKMSDELAKKHQDHAREREEQLRKLSGKEMPHASSPSLRGKSAVSAMKEFVAQSHEEARKQHEAWEREFSDNVQSIAKDLCSDLAHRDSPACAAFQSSKPNAVGAIEKPAPMTHDEWLANIANEAESYHRELCADPQRKGTAPCIAYEGRTAQNVSGAHADGSGGGGVSTSLDVKKDLRGSAATSPGASSLAWRSVKSWKATPDPHASERLLTTVTRSEVRHAHWGGMIPKVGLITVIPSGHDAKFRMRYFMDNFILQNYEGAKQLILVYRHGDSAALELANEYADGSYIKAVASRGVDTFPSSADYRFGAYSSDADIIARWEFNEFHMPHQISTQVRAMALSSRPASVLSVVGQEFGREESLIGEASWMREHWLPLSETERDVLQHSRAHQIVQVDEDRHTK